MTDGINDKLKATLAYQIAAKLDAKDGTVDNKIQKTIWDDFIKDKGGKTVEEFIDIESAMKSITTYAVRNAKNGEDSVNDLAKAWFDSEPAINDDGNKNVNKRKKNNNKVNGNRPINTEKENLSITAGRESNIIPTANGLNMGKGKPVDGEGNELSSTKDEKFKQGGYIMKYTQGDKISYQTTYKAAPGKQYNNVKLTADSIEELKELKTKYEDEIKKVKAPVEGESEEAAKARKAANLEALKNSITITNGNIQVIKNVAEKLLNENYVDRTSEEYKAFVQDLLLTRNSDVIKSLLPTDSEGNCNTTVLEKDKTAHETLAGIYQEIRAKEKAGEKLTDEEIKLKEELSNLKSVKGYKIEADSTKGVHEKYMDYSNMDGIPKYSSEGYGSRDPKLLDTFLTELNAADTDEKKTALFKKYIDTKDPELANSLASMNINLKAKDEDIIALINNNGLEVIDCLNNDINSKAVIDAAVAKAKEIYTSDKGNLENAVYLDSVMYWIDITDLSDEEKEKAKKEILETYFEVSTDNDGNKTYSFNPSRRATYEEMRGLVGQFYDDFNEALVKYTKLDDMGKGQYNEALESGLVGRYTVPHYAEMVDKMNTKEDVIDFIDNKVTARKNDHLPFDKIVEKFPDDKDIADRLVQNIDGYSTISDETKTILTKQYIKIDGNNITFDKSKLPQGVDVAKFVNNILPSNCTQGDASKYFSAVLKTLGKNDLDLIAGAKSKNPTAVKSKIAELVKSNQNDKEFIQKVAKLDKELIPFGELYNIDAQQAQWDDATKAAVFRLLDNGIKSNEREKYLNNAVNKHWVTKVAQDRYAIGDMLYATDWSYYGEDEKANTDDDILIIRSLSKTGYEHGQAMFKELEGAGSGDITKMLRSTEKGFENYVTPDNVVGIIDGFYSKSTNEGIMQYIANEWGPSAGVKPGKALCNRIPKALMRKAAYLDLQNTEAYKKLADFFGCSNDGKFTFSKNDEAGERYNEKSAKQLDLLIDNLCQIVLIASMYKISHPPD